MPEESPLRFPDSLLENYADVDNLVMESFSDKTISNLPYEDERDIRRMMAALSRFLGHLQFTLNLHKAAVVRLKRQFEGLKNKTAATLDGITDRTSSNVLLTKVYKKEPKLEKIQEQLAIEESWVEYYNGLPDRISEHIQVFKYELRRREDGRQ